MNKFSLYFYSFAAIICIVLVVFGLHVFPVPGTDSAVFIPPALLYSKGFGLSNPLYYVTQFTDPTHTNRFNYYVPFYSWLLGILSSVKPGIKTIFLFCSLFSSLCILLYCRAVASWFPARMSNVLNATILLSLTYVATYLIPTVGRPEGITSLLLFLIFLLYRNRLKSSLLVYNTLICILFALVLASQIMGFFFGFLFLVTYDLLNEKNAFRVLGINVFRAAVVVLLFTLVLALSPNGLANTITGIRLHINYVLNRDGGGFSEYLFFWIYAPLSFGFIGIFLICSIFYFRELAARIRHVERASRVLLIAVQCVLVLGFVKFIVYAAPTIYNATQFILPMMVYLVYQAIIPAAGKPKPIYVYALTITYLAGTLIFLRGLILFADYQQDGKTFDAAKVKIDSLLQANPNIYITNSLWPVPENTNDLKMFSVYNFKKGDTVIFQQANHDYLALLHNNYTTIYDWRTTTKRKFFGIPLTNRPQGYSFVVCIIK